MRSTERGSDKHADGDHHELPDDAVLLSIEPVWAEAILDGVKRWEYRRAPPALEPPYRVILYAIAPQQKAVGEAVIVDQVSGDPEAVINETCHETPNDPERVSEYFDGSDMGHALRIGGASWFKNPVTMAALRQHDVEPIQSFRYVESDLFGGCKVVP